MQVPTLKVKPTTTELSINESVILPRKAWEQADKENSDVKLDNNWNDESLYSNFRVLYENMKLFLQHRKCRIREQQSELKNEQELWLARRQVYDSSENPNISLFSSLRQEKTLLDARARILNDEIKNQKAIMELFDANEIFFENQANPTKKSQENLMSSSGKGSSKVVDGQDIVIRLRLEK